jgi:ABC-type dipeptide/oligopeptide/nickel transport system permease component
VPGRLVQVPRVRLRLSVGRFPATLSVAVGGAICFLALGLSSGIFAARRRGTASDKAS